MSCDVVVIGIGNEFRRDDGVGLAVAEELASRNLAGVQVVTAIGEPGAILDAWTGARLAVVVDAAMDEGATPGRIGRWTPSDEVEPAAVSSHALSLPQTYALGEALGQLPARLVVLTVDITDSGNGVGLTPAVAAAVPEVITAVLEELGRCL